VWVFPPPFPFIAGRVLLPPFFFHGSWDQLYIGLSVSLFFLPVPPSRASIFVFAAKQLRLVFCQPKGLSHLSGFFSLRHIFIFFSDTESYVLWIWPLLVDSVFFSFPLGLRLWLFLFFGELCSLLWFSRGSAL